MCRRGVRCHRLRRVGGSRLRPGRRHARRPAAARQAISAEHAGLQRHLLQAVGYRRQGARALDAVGRAGWERISVTVDQVHAMIDGFVGQLRGQGAQRIVVGGQSLGANVALSYAVARQNIAACVMLAPGHSPAYVSRTYPDVAGLLEKAAAMVNSGQGNQLFKGTDDNQGSKLSLNTTAAAYLSWLNPRGQAAMQAQAPLLPASIPLLMVMGKQDPAFNCNEANVYRPAAKNPYSKYIVVNAGHRDTDFAASAQVVSWIQGLPA
ncbi:MAG: alpha/beta fold hydrolase [Reyranella sp.]|nr:MAG: alpha/beta fold hydrolase [Reyranella sp.]